MRPSPVVNQEYITKFKELYLRKYKISLTDEEATKQATELLNLMVILVFEPKKVAS